MHLNLQCKCSNCAAGWSADRLASIYKGYYIEMRGPLNPRGGDPLCRDKREATLPCDEGGYKASGNQHAAAALAASDPAFVRGNGCAAAFGFPWCENLQIVE